MATAQSRRLEKDSDLIWLDIRFDNGGTQPLLVPGFGHPVSVELSADKRFAHGFNDWAQDRLTAREIVMLQLMNTITDRIDWVRVVSDHNQALLDEWKVKLIDLPLISSRTWQWCLAELRDKAKLYSTTGIIHVYDSASRVCKSDTLISPSLLRSLESQVERFVQRHKASSRPHSTPSRRRALVDPHFLPLIFGRSLVLRDATVITPTDMLLSVGKGTVATKCIREPPSHSTRLENMRTLGRQYEIPGDTFGHMFSSSFQWLPCEVGFNHNESGGISVRINSYINNIHPVLHSDMYRSLEMMISASIGPWNNVLAWRDHPRTPSRIRTFGAIWDIPADAFTDWSHRYECRHWQHPEPGTAFTYEDWKDGRSGAAIVPARASGEKRFLPPKADHSFYTIRLEDTFVEEGLQVVVEIGSIDLTPEQPTCEATEWALVGNRNERIVATTILYFCSVNVTADSAAISFRVEADVDPEQHIYGHATTPHPHDPFRPLADIYGVVPPEDLFETDERGGGPAMQELGTVQTPDGRLIAFPNTLQHRIEASVLADPTKPGSRRYLRLHLVDPHYRICSTRNVPPQQHDWWARAALDRIDWNSYHMPPELRQRIIEAVGEFPIARREAELYRKQFLDEQREIHNQVIADVQRYCLGEWAEVSAGEPGAWDWDASSSANR